MSNGETIKGGNHGCNKSITIPNSLKKIEVIFTKCEAYLYYIRFIASDGTITQIGKENSSSASGRSEIFELEPGEQLLGCVLHHGQNYTFGVTWIKWRPP